jgi:hypothetical protein
MGQTETTMKDKGYNGWTNYETWNLALWIGNEQGSYEYWREQTREVIGNTSDDDVEERKHTSACDLADMLKEYIEEAMPEMDASFFSDLLRAAVSEVNWYEIAKGWVDEEWDDVVEGELVEEGE